MGEDNNDYGAMDDYGDDNEDIGYGNEEDDDASPLNGFVN